MRRAREKGKVSFETYKEPDSKETKDLKKALSSKIPTEIDYYLEDADHEEGSNVYTFKFPPEWRTLVSADLVFGVRGFYSTIKKSFTLKGKFSQHQVQISDERDFIATVNFEYSFDDYNDLSGFAAYLDDKLRGKVMEAETFYKTNIYSKAEINYLTYDRRKPNLIRELGKFRIYVNAYTIDPKVSFDTYYILFEFKDYNDDFKRIFNVDKPDYPSRDILIYGFNMYQTYDIHASFINTKHHHLGFNNIQYTPIKYYKIDNNVAEFKIMLYKVDGYTPVEFPDTGKEHFIIETLILQDSNYLLTI